jgi:hypothetical protein
VQPGPQWREHILIGAVRDLGQSLLESWRGGGGSETSIGAQGGVNGGGVEIMFSGVVTTTSFGDIAAYRSLGQGGVGTRRQQVADEQDWTVELQRRGGKKVAEDVGGHWRL